MQHGLSKGIRLRTYQCSPTHIHPQSLPVLLRSNRMNYAELSAYEATLRYAFAAAKCRTWGAVECSARSESAGDCGGLFRNGLGVWSGSYTSCDRPYRTRIPFSTPQMNKPWYRDNAAASAYVCDPPCDSTFWQPPNKPIIKAITYFVISNPSNSSNVRRKWQFSTDSPTSGPWWGQLTWLQQRLETTRFQRLNTTADRPHLIFISC